MIVTIGISCCSYNVPIFVEFVFPWCGKITWPFDVKSVINNCFNVFITC